jgi:dihydroflavonol-4-reductase
MSTPSVADEALEFVAADLTSDAGWRDAMTAVTTVIHTASPFPIAQPRDANDLVRPALDGTRRALGAAVSGGVNRVVLTSSGTAITSTETPASGVFTEANWSRTDAKAITLYMKSKTLAERAAWGIAEASPATALTVINPSFVLGPPLDGPFGSSISVIERMLPGKDPAVPRLGFSIVDVRDVALALVRARTPRDSGQALCPIGWRNVVPRHGRDPEGRLSRQADRRTRSSGLAPTPPRALRRATARDRSGTRAD